MTYIIETDWTTKAGLRAICLWNDEAAHRCGYVEVPVGHPLFGVGYNEHAPVLAELLVKAQNGPIGKRGIISLVCASGDENAARPDIVFDVHGSLTYSSPGDGYPATTDGWWFGFDCGHCDDGSRYNPGPERSQEYVIAECERLAEQLAAVGDPTPA